MAENYIPAGHPSAKSLNTTPDPEFIQQMKVEREQAKHDLLESIADLGRLGIETVQFEVVRPLGRLATLAQKLNPFQDNSIIRADTIRQYGTHHDYTQRHALLAPREGYLLPTVTEGWSDQFQKAIFLDGTTGTAMKWDQFEKRFAFYVNFSPPDKAYWCDEAGRVKFSPRNPDDGFEHRNCKPVWGESLRPLSGIDSKFSIDFLAKQVEALSAVAQAEEVINNIRWNEQS